MFAHGTRRSSALVGLVLVLVRQSAEASPPSKAPLPSFRSADRTLGNVKPGEFAVCPTDLIAMDAQRLAVLRMREVSSTVLLDELLIIPRSGATTYAVELGPHIWEGTSVTVAGEDVVALSGTLKEPKRLVVIPRRGDAGVRRFLPEGGRVSLSRTGEVLTILERLMSQSRSVERFGQVVVNGHRAPEDRRRTDGRQRLALTIRGGASIGMSQDEHELTLDIPLIDTHSVGIIGVDADGNVHLLIDLIDWRERWRHPKRVIRVDRTGTLSGMILLQPWSESGGVFGSSHVALTSDGAVWQLWCEDQAGVHLRCWSTASGEAGPARGIP